jgi:hypothetical protein
MPVIPALRRLRLEEVPDQPELHSETLTQKTKKIHIINTISAITELRTGS